MPRPPVETSRPRSHRALALACLAAALALAGCRTRQVRRPAGDEVPYPTFDAEALDRSTPPCQDFYRFACGRWLAQTPVPPDRIRWERGASEVEERNARLLRRILDEAGAGRVGTQDRYGRKAGDFYGACMDEADVEAHGLAELQAEWARIDAAGDGGELAGELCRLEAMGLRVPFGLRARTDPADPARLLLVLGREGVGLPGREPAGAASPPAPDVGDAWAAHVRALLQLGGVPAARAEEQAAGALAVERGLAGADPAPAPGAAPERLDRAALERLAPGFPWASCLRVLGAERLPAVGAADTALLARAGRVFAEAPLESWKAYLRVRLVEAMAAERALPARMVEEWARFQRTLGPAPAQLRPRWRDCVDTTARTFASAVGGTFARKHLRAAGRERARDLVVDLMRGTRAAVQSAPWMDAGTRARAGARLDRLVAQVGYPDAEFPDYNALRVGKESYFRNLLSAGRFAVALEVGRASRPADRSEWVVGPFQSAPFYSPATNVLCVPAGALQPPAYDPGAPAPVVLGAFGTAVGARLAEALRGAPGENAGCMPAAALSDAAGLRIAYEAMRLDRAAHPGAETKLVGFTPEQQFFVAYAQARCTAAADEDPARPAGVGPGVPAQFRVNGPLADMPEFASAFRCEPGTPMARPAAARCDLW